jgi:hypothetical protein
MMPEHDKNRGLYRIICVLGVFCLAGCDNFNQSIEDFIFNQTGTVLPRGAATIVSPQAAQDAGGAFYITAAQGTAVDIVLELGLENDRSYDLRIVALNNGAASDAVTAEQTAPDLVRIRIAGAKPGDVYCIVLTMETKDGRRTFDWISLPDICCVSGNKALLVFAFGSWTGSVDEGAKTVAVTVPYGTEISGISPTVTVSPDADYSPKESWGSDDSGISKTYTVTAADGTIATYTVTVTIAATVYNITINSSANGMVTASPATAAEGEIVILTASADTGYSLKPGTLRVKQTTSGAVVAVSSSAPYTFAMPAADVTVTAEFAVYNSSITNYLALKDAIEASPPGSPRVYLLKNGTFTADTVGAGITINNNKDISIIVDGDISIQRTTGFGAMFTVEGGATLNLGLPGMTGSLVIDGVSSQNTGALVAVSGGTLNMYDGVILRNNKNTGNGGAVYVTGSGSTFNMNGGTIHENKATSATSNGGGVYVSGGGSFVISGTAAITDNTANNHGGGVFVNGLGSSFAMNGGTISGNKAPTANKNGGGVYVSGRGSFVMSGIAAITGNTTKHNGGGVYVTGFGSSFAMNGGTISGGSFSENAENGGGVFVSSDASFVMNSGSIVGNKAKQGGGVFISGGESIVTLTSFIMASGSISRNEATSFGGGVCIIGEKSRFAMQGGTIGGSASGEENTAGNGNGVYVGNLGVFAMSGTSSLIGANGVHIKDSATSFSMAGGATVDPDNDQIYLESGKFVTLSGNLTGTGPRAKIELQSATWGTTKVLDGDNISYNKTMFTLKVSSNTYPGATHINDNGIIINGP